MHTRFLKAAAAVTAACSAAWMIHCEPYMYVQQMPYESAVYEARLENGLTLYAAEDFSDALVRIEYTVRAGYADQNANTAGFAPLYTRLFPQAAPDAGLYASILNAECTDTAARYSMSVTPQQAGQALAYIAACAFDPVFSDNAVTLAAAELSRQMHSFEQSPAGFINTVIDSLIFAGAPYTHAAGTDPSVFDGKTPAQIRSVLHDISRTLYVPQNSALFISGAISAQEAEQLASAAFGQYRFPAQNGSRAEVRRGGNLHTNPAEPAASAGVKRFVLIDSAFSKDLHQIILQYAPGSPAFNTPIRALQYLLAHENSDFMQLLVSDTELGISLPGYVSCSAAALQGSDRLIIQTLAAKTGSPARQAVLTEQYVRQAVQNLRLQPGKTDAAVHRVRTDYAAAADTASYMSALAQRYGLAYQPQSQAESADTLSDTPALPDLPEPFIFVLAHPDTYKTYAKSFAENGFSPVYRSDMPRLRAPQKAAEPASGSRTADIQPAQNRQTSPAERFAQEQAADITVQNLLNGIPLVVKKSPNSSGISFILEIAGGERHSPPQSPGLETILVQAVARNISAAAAESARQGIITKLPAVAVSTGTDSSYIQIECSTADFEQCVSITAGALLFGDIRPSDADELVYTQQYAVRAESAGLSFQMYKAAMLLLYSGTEYEPLFTADTETAVPFTYDKIAAAYPQLLDAGRFRLIAAGGEPADSRTIAEIFEMYFGVFAPFPRNSERSSTAAAKIEPQFPETERHVQLRRIFTADRSSGSPADRPPVLIPTTEFSDPVQYYSPAPKTAEEQALYNALLYELENRLNGAIRDGILPADSLQIHTASLLYPYGAVQFAGVPSAFDIDSFFYGTADKLYRELGSPDTVFKIRNSWIHKELSKTRTNAGTVQLIAESLLNTGTPFRHAQAYTAIESAEQSDFMHIMENWMQLKPPVRLYSASRR